MHVEGGIEILTTPLLLCEVANALRYKPDYDPQKLVEAIGVLSGLHLITEEIDKELLIRAEQIAFGTGVIIYDALPVARVEKHGITCITADNTVNL